MLLSEFLSYCSVLLLTTAIVGILTVDLTECRVYRFYSGNLLSLSSPLFCDFHSFTGQEFTRRVSISSAAIQYMVESEPGTVRCQADNVDSLELIHVASGRIVTNNSSAPQTLTVAESIILPTVQGDDGQKYICRGNNSVVNVFNQTTIELSVASKLFTAALVGVLTIDLTSQE